MLKGGKLILNKKKKMRAVYKYPLEKSQTEIEMPENAEIVTAGRDPGNQFCIWAIVNTEAPLEKKKFVVLGTGQEIPNNAWYLKSFRESVFVWHVFELV